MATPWSDPRTGRLYLRRQIPEQLRPAFGGRAIFKISLKTKDPDVARVAFARENAAFEEQLADARRRLEDGALVPSPAGLVKRYFEAPGRPGGSSGPRRLMVALLQLDMAVDAWIDHAAPTRMPPQGLDYEALEADDAVWRDLVERFLEDDEGRIGSLFWSVRWFEAPSLWRPFMDGPIARLKAFDVSAAQFTDDAIADAILAVYDRVCPEKPDATESRKARVRAPRLRPHMRFRQLFSEWKEGNSPTGQTAAEFERVVEDFIDFVGDVPVSSVTADMLFDFRDEAAKLPKAMPRKDRELPFTQRVAKHDGAFPKCEPSTLKKRMSGLQALLTYAFQQRWTTRNEGVGVPVVGYSKVHRRHRRSFQDAELGALFASPLFTQPATWAASKSKFSDATMFWLFLVGGTTGARLEEVGQAAVSDIRSDGDIVYLDIDDYVVDDAEPSKHVKTEESLRLVPIHDKLVEIGFVRYVEALKAAGHTQLFPDLEANAFGKRTNTISQRINRHIDAVVGTDRRLVFHSLRHSFKALGNDAGVSPRVLDQICGHAPIDVGSRYGSEPRIRTTHRELHRIDFGCIDWRAIVVPAALIDWSHVVTRHEIKRAA